MRAQLLPRLLSALPDTVTAFFFLTLWLSPLQLGKSGVRNGMLIMLVEFIVVHASGILGATAFAAGVTARNKFRAIAGFGAFYLLFIAAWSWAFREWWPFAVFGWLLLAKFSFALNGQQLKADRLHQLQSSWAIATMAYLAGVTLTILVPMPRLGMARITLATLELPGSGYWVSHPHSVIAFGLFYFTVLAITKALDIRLPRMHLPDIRKS